MFILAVGCGGESVIAPTATPGGPVGAACADIPPLDPLASPQAEMAGDPELEAQFPDEVDGQPVENVNSFRWLEYLCRFGEAGAADIAAGAAAAAGVNLLALTYGSGRATIAEQEIGIDAFRTPGVGANLLITQFPQMVLVFGGTTAEQGGSMAQATIGGKDAFVWTQPDNDVTYLYVHGDVMFGMTYVTEAEAATILAALP